MSFFGGAEQVHHHGLLAGVGAGAAAVLVLAGFAVLSWHRIAGPVGDVFITIAVTVAVAVVMAAVYGAVLAFLHLRHKSRQFAVAVPAVPVMQAAMQAQVLGSAAPGALPAPVTGQLPETHMHVHLPPGMAPEAVAVALRSAYPALSSGAAEAGLSRGPAELEN